MKCMKISGGMHKSVKFKWLDFVTVMTAGNEQQQTVHKYLTGLKPACKVKKEEGIYIEKDREVYDNINGKKDIGRNCYWKADIL